MKNFTYLIILCFSLSAIAQNSATYDITFTSTWNAAEHTSIPTGAHWSRLVGATHKVENTFLELGQNATTGIKNVAELGSNSTFMAEVQASPNAKEWLNEPLSPYGAIGSATLSNIEFTLEHHLISLVSMVAPSPDWFMAVNSLDLRNSTNTTWKDSFTLDVFAYDSGTDNGTDYDSLDSPNTPVGISLISGTPFNGNKIGTLTVTKKPLSTAKFNANKNTLQLYPNPSTKGKITITNALKYNLYRLEIYTVLGRKVYATTIPKANTFSLNINQLSAGVYLMKLNSETNSISKKLIIQ